MKNKVKRGRPVGSSKKNADFMNLPYGGIPSDKLIPKLVQMDDNEEIEITKKLEDIIERRLNQNKDD
jgi:hypothetical protein